MTCKSWKELDTILDLRIVDFDLTSEDIETSVFDILNVNKQRYNLPTEEEVLDILNNYASQNFTTQFRLIDKLLYKYNLRLNYIAYNNSKIGLFITDDSTFEDFTEHFKNLSTRKQFYSSIFTFANIDNYVNLEHVFEDEDLPFDAYVALHSKDRFLHFNYNSSNIIVKYYSHFVAEIYYTSDNKGFYPEIHLFDVLSRTSYYSSIKYDNENLNCFVVDIQTIEGENLHFEGQGLANLILYNNDDEKVFNNNAVYNKLNSSDENIRDTKHLDEDRDILFSKSFKFDNPRSVIFRIVNTKNDFYKNVTTSMLNTFIDYVFYDDNGYVICFILKDGRALYFK